MVLKTITCTYSIRFYNVSVSANNQSINLFSWRFPSYPYFRASTEVHDCRDPRGVTVHRKIDWLIIYGFTSCSRIFHLYGDVTIAGEGLQNLGLCSAPRAFTQGGIFIVPRGVGFFRFHPKDRSIQSPFTTHEGMWRIYSNPDRHSNPPEETSIHRLNWCKTHTVITCI
jgi:hypothetical protein